MLIKVSIKALTKVLIEVLIQVLTKVLTKVLTITKVLIKVLTVFSARCAAHPALLVVLDIQVTPPDEDGQGLERCLEQLQQFAPSAIIAWLVSTETPASTRQVRICSLNDCLYG